jgi:hypothetical protein
MSCWFGGRLIEMSRSCDLLHLDDIMMAWNIKLRRRDVREWVEQWTPYLDEKATIGNVHKVACIREILGRAQAWLSRANAFIEARYDSDSDAT